MLHSVGRYWSRALLVERAGFPVGGDDQGLEAAGQDVLLVVLGHVRGDGVDALGRFEHGHELVGPLQQAAQGFLGAGPFLVHNLPELVQQVGELALQLELVDPELGGGQGVVEGQRRAVLDALVDAVLVVDALGVALLRQRFRRCPCPPCPGRWACR